MVSGRRWVHPISVFPKFVTFNTNAACILHDILYPLAFNAYIKPYISMDQNDIEKMAILIVLALFAGTFGFSPVKTARAAQASADTGQAKLQLLNICSKLERSGGRHLSAIEP
jgi:hypothetical protein